MLLEEVVIVLRSRLVVVLTLSAEEVEVAEYEVVVEAEVLAVDIDATRVVGAVAGITQGTLEHLGFLQVTLEEVHEVVGISPVLGVLLPTRVGIVYGLGNEGHLAVGLHELEISPGADGYNLCILAAHVEDVVLDGVGVYLGEVEVALVDDLVVGRTVEKGVVAILAALVVDKVSDAVATVRGGGHEVASEVRQQLVLLYHVLYVTKNTQIEINGVISAEAFAVTIHIGRQHVFAGSGAHTKSQKEDEEA